MVRIGNIRIATPRSPKIRPTSALARKVFFDTASGLVADALFLDLFAGTGAVGLEALGKGASFAVFVEKDRRVVATLRGNVDAMGATPRSLVICRDAVRFLKRQYKPETADIVFADPPYEQGYLKVLADLLFLPERLPRRLLAVQASKHELAGLKLNADLDLVEKALGDTILVLVRPA